MSAGAPAPAAHELNTSFTWTDHDGPFRAVTAAQARQYDELGFFVLEDALGRGEVDALVGAIDPVEARGEETLRAMEDGRFFIARADEITFTTHLVLQSPVLRDFTTSAVLVDVCADLIGPAVRLYWDQAVYKKPDTESPFPWHQDNGYAFVEPQQYLTCWVALTDATEENGCPWVVPGLHRRGTLAHEYSDIGFVCLRDTGRRRARARAGREHRRVLVADTSLDRAEQDRGRAQGLHRAVRPGGGHGGAARAGRLGEAVPRRRRVPPVRGVAGGRAHHAVGALPPPVEAPIGIGPGHRESAAPAVG